jgi:hypothetical protein
VTDPRKLAEDTLRQWGTTGNIPLNSETLARELLKVLDERDIAKEQHANTLNRLLSERAERDRLERERDEAREQRDCAGERADSTAALNRDLTAERDRLAEALRTICTTNDSGPWIEVYRKAGDGYEGLQAIARAALASLSKPDGGA